MRVSNSKILRKIGENKQTVRRNSHFRTGNIQDRKMKVKDLVEQVEKLNCEINEAVTTSEKISIEDGILLFKEWIELMNTEVELKSDVVK